MPKIYFYFDESGDPTILGRKGKNLLKENLVSKTFSVGYIKTENPHKLLFLQQPSQIPLLQVVDYMLWTVFRVYEKDEFRFFDYMKEKINFIYDIFDGTQKGTVYNKENPLEQKK